MRAIKVFWVVVAVLLIVLLFLGWKMQSLFYLTADYLTSCETFDESWLKCQEDKDCMPISLCRPMGAVNLRFSQDINECNRQKLSVMSCPPPDSNNQNEISAQCVYGQCTLLRD